VQEIFLRAGGVPTCRRCSYVQEMFLRAGDVPTCRRCSYVQEVFRAESVTLRAGGLFAEGVNILQEVSEFLRKFSLRKWC
jgi:hypothetical protein